MLLKLITCFLHNFFLKLMQPLSQYDHSMIKFHYNKPYIILSFYTFEQIFKQSNVSNSSFNARLNITWFARDPSWLRLPVMFVCDSWITLSTSRRSVTPSLGSPINSRTKLEKLRSRSDFSFANNSVTELNCRKPISAWWTWPLYWIQRLRVSKVAFRIILLC